MSSICLKHYLLYFKDVNHGFLNKLKIGILFKEQLAIPPNSCKCFKTLKNIIQEIIFLKHYKSYNK